jgi:uncharacterized protein (DUF427 family)
VSVWSYPRPPRLEPEPRRLRVRFAGELIAETRRGFRVIETSHPPNYYFPVDDVAPEVLERSARTSFCEFKGQAHYCTVRAGGRAVSDAAWGYDHPSAGYEPLAGTVAFYVGPMDACLVDDELVVAQPGGFYGGWITCDVAGPFKGGPGSGGW